MACGGALGVRRSLRDSGVLARREKTKPNWGTGPLDQLEWMRRHRGLGPVLNVIQLLYLLALLFLGVVLAPLWVPMFLGWGICGVAVGAALTLIR